MGKQQLIEIAKALSKDVKLLILDEPTAALNEDDSENLLKLIRELKQHGVTCIMISHKLKEVIDDCGYGHGAARRPDDLHPGCPQRRGV